MAFDDACRGVGRNAWVAVIALALVPACGSSSSGQASPDAGGGADGGGAGGSAGTAAGGSGGASGADGSAAAGGSGGTGAVGTGGTSATSGTGGAAGAASCTPLAQLPTEPDTTVDLASACPASAPCGGSLDGKSLTLGSVCLAQDALFAQIAGVCSAATVRSPSGGSASGSATFTGSSVQLVVHASASIDVDFPNSCTGCRCTDLEGTLASAGLIASCSPVCNGGVCSCTVQGYVDLNESGTYTVSGDTLTLPSGATFDFCAGASDLTIAGTGELGSATFVPHTSLPERCNGLDDDRNGTIDDAPEDCAPCNTAGVCAAFTATCNGVAGWSCDYTSASYQATETACDGLDNDCDGQIDEPSTEVCNGRDDDCDGRIDQQLESDADCVAQHGVGYVCSSGSCTCPNLCGGVCADVQNDVNHCGLCSKACPTGASCSSGTCQCPSGAPTDCGAACSDLTTDAANCDTCGHSCAIACNSRQCVTVLSLALGDYVSCAAMSDGTARCWGLGSQGALGDGGTNNSPRPGAVSGLTTVSGVAVGTRCAWLADRTARCWGANDFGEIGDGTTAVRYTPVPVSGLSGVAGVAATSQFTCAWTTTGSAYCWGDPSNGQLGLAGAGFTPNLPNLLATLGSVTVTSMAVGLQHACALTANSLYCWGDGPGTPALVAGVTTATQVVAGSLHTCVRLANGTVQCWGANGEGQLGDGGSSPQSAPQTVPALGGVRELAAGSEHGCAVLGDDTVTCWGWNQDGQLGDGTNVTQRSPTPVPGLTGVDHLAAGGNHTCALLKNGTVRCWGNDVFGQLGDGTPGGASSSPVTVVW